ncbi:MAG: SpoVG family protein [Elusimicrobiota bacterium]
MEITEIRIYLRKEEKLKAFATVTFDNCFAVRNMKIISGTHGLILCMPSRKLPDGSYQDVAHPVTAAFRKTIEDKVLALYRREISRADPGV